MLLAKHLRLWSSKINTHNPSIKQAVDERWQTIAEPSKSPNITNEPRQRLPIIVRVASLPPGPLHEIFESDYEWLRHEKPEFSNLTAYRIEVVPLVEQHAQGEGDIQLQVL